MPKSSIHRIGACVLAMALCAPTAHAQDAATLKRENARLNAELAQLRNQCGAQSGGDVGNQNGLGSEQRVGDLGMSVVALRAGTATGYTDSHVAVTTTVRIRNNGQVPVSLNYNQRTFGLVDDRGYEYKLDKEDSTVYFGNSVKGIGMATSSKASTRDVLLPGQSQNVTFIAIRYMRDGQTVGSTFDLNATFGQYQDVGEGRIRSLRSYPVAFIGVPRSAGAQAVGESVRQSGKNIVEGVLKGLFGN